MKVKERRGSNAIEEVADRLGNITNLMRHVLTTKVDSRITLRDASRLAIVEIAGDEVNLSQQAR